MRKYQSTHVLYLFCLIVGLMYVSVTLFIDVLHNHQDINKFHDDCAACRWVDQSQDTSISTSSTQAFLIIPSLEGNDFYIPDEPFLISHLYKTNYFTRPPPSI